MASLMLSGLITSMSQVMLCLPQMSIISCVSLIPPIILPFTTRFPVKIYKWGSCLFWSNMNIVQEYLFINAELQMLPNIKGKEGNSIGFSGAPTNTKVPFTLSNSKMGPREWLADTVSKMKSRLLLAFCHHTITKKFINIDQESLVWFGLTFPHDLLFSFLRNST